MSMTFDDLTSKVENLYKDIIEKGKTIKKGFGGFSIITDRIEAENIRVSQVSQEYGKSKFQTELNIKIIPSQIKDYSLLLEGIYKLIESQKEE